MSAPFVAEIRIFPFNFAPTGWAVCNGQLLPISQNTALFALLGTFYGGDGKSTFALPNLSGHLALHTGANQPGPGLSVWDLGQDTGSETVTLLDTEMPAHNHAMVAANTNGTTVDATNNQLSKGFKGNIQANTTIRMYSTANPNTQLGFTAMSAAGSSFPHNNLMPYLTLRYCIALQGVFPARG